MKKLDLNYQLKNLKNIQMSDAKKKQQLEDLMDWVDQHDNLDQNQKPKKDNINKTEKVDIWLITLGVGLMIALTMLAILLIKNSFKQDQNSGSVKGIQQNITPTQIMMKDINENKRDSNLNDDQNQNVEKKLKKSQNSEDTTESVVASTQRPAPLYQPGSNMHSTNQADETESNQSSEETDTNQNDDGQNSGDKGESDDHSQEDGNSEDEENNDDEDNSDSETEITNTPTLSQSPTPTLTTTSTPTPTQIPTSTITPTISPTPIITPTLSPTPTITPTMKPSPTPSATSTPTPTIKEDDQWQAFFFNNTQLTETVAIDQHQDINFYWSTELRPHPKINKENFSIKWQKKRYFKPGSYMIRSLNDDGVRVYLDDELVIDDWNQHYPEHNSYEFINLEHKLTTIKVEYFNGPRNACIVIDICNLSHENCQEKLLFCPKEKEGFE